MSSILDHFLLWLIDAGIWTSYAMQQQAGVSVGASRPALARLERLKLVKGRIALQGRRSSVKYELTATGRRERESLRAYLQQPALTMDLDVDNALRAMALAESLPDPKLARKLAMAAALTARRPTPVVLPSADEGILSRLRIRQLRWADLNGEMLAEYLIGVATEIAGGRAPSLTAVRAQQAGPKARRRVLNR
jgi:DNA-binding PadR family transcriptional regulator